MQATRNKIVQHIQESLCTLDEKKVMVGIDAFVDKIMRAVSSKSEQNDYTFFNDIAQFGDYVTSKSGKSCGIEVCERFTKYGGNGPIMAESIACLGINTDCIGAVGYPDMENIFKGLSPKCTFHSIGNPGYTTALEFEDGKVMLNYREPLNKIDWQEIKRLLGLDAIKQFFEQSHLIALVNWSGMIHYNEIFQGILDEVLLNKPVNKNQVLFFDMADFSVRTDILEAIELVNAFSAYYKVIFGLNENEAIALYKQFNPDAALPDLKTIGQNIFDTMHVDCFVIHTLTNAIAWEKGTISETESLYVAQPKLSTGGG
ncbi:MAG: hypothetical protein H7Y41_05785, partial [Hyphomonadaceae bacterium]|nr:hypothetical protein [Clostridia bacterium]